MPRSLVCLSHLRWDFVYQRPNHLMARAATEYEVMFVEEPVADERPAGLELRPVDGLTVVRPHLPRELAASAAAPTVLEGLLRDVLRQRPGGDPVLWYYTPMALPWTEGIRASAVVYDCMDELSAFRSAPPALVSLEAALLDRADLVFTGGRSLFEAKRSRSSAVHCFPSGVDLAHFRRARDPQPDPSDQAGIPRPRIGYFGVIDERIDLELVGEVARRRPEWQVVLVGPIAKVDPARVPPLPNVHHLGRKDYAELPAYLAGWDVALMPFARNEATRFISPTKTPEYLAGGKPVVSTSIRDVVEPYGREALVRIADTPESMVAAIEATLAGDEPQRTARFEALIGRQTWDATWAAMAGLVGTVVARRQAPLARPRGVAAAARRARTPDAPALEGTGA
jgi:glycosyltransferase involved in cell wall biosynthesis